jgi:hypothetical protein
MSAKEYVLLYNAEQKTWSVLVIEEEHASVASSHPTKLEAERAFALVKGGAS